MAKFIRNLPHNYNTIKYKKNVLELFLVHHSSYDYLPNLSEPKKTIFKSGDIVEYFSCFYQLGKCVIIQKNPVTKNSVASCKERTNTSAHLASVAKNGTLFAFQNIGLLFIKKK